MANVAEIILRSISLGIAVMGAYFLLCAFMPASWHTKKTKNTVGINLLMFSLHAMVGLFFFTGAVLLAAAGFAGFKPEKIDGPLTGIVFTVLNGCCMTGSFYIIHLKWKHMQAAKRLGIGEAEYHRDYVARDSGSLDGATETALDVVE